MWFLLFFMLGILPQSAEPFDLSPTPEASRRENLTEFIQLERRVPVLVPRGYPAEGPITSEFGWRPSIKSEVEKPKTLGQGGDITTTMRVLTPEPTLTPAPVTPPAVSPTPTPEPSATPTVPLPTATPSPTPTAAPTPTVTQRTHVWGVEISPTVTSSPTPTPTVTPELEFHAGIDIGVPEGTFVRATADGIVEYASDGRGGYGSVIFITHPSGYTTIYGHNSRLLVLAGQTVRAGDVIALSGNTGYSTGPHLHYEIRRNGQPIDPKPFLEDEG
jgi:murein DD-endopeptidase MepM/ murein hydrolase activator NlpD